MAKIKDVDKFLQIVPPKLRKHSEALIVLLAWFRHKSNYHPKMSQISKETGISMPHVSRAFSKLMEMNILSRFGFDSNGRNIKQTPTFKLHRYIIDEIKGQDVQEIEEPLETLKSKEIIEEDSGLADYQQMPEEEILDIDPKDMAVYQEDKDFVDMMENSNG